MTSVVYFVRIDKHIKIGVTSNLESRLKAFATSAPSVERLLSVAGDRDLERKLHALFSETRIARELFHYDGRMQDFIHHVQFDGLESGLQFLVDTAPSARKAAIHEDRRRRVLKARQSRAELNGHFARLVAERKQLLGW